MKFLLFNIVVLGALFYLHANQRGPDDTVTDRIRAHVEAVASTVGSDAGAPSPEPIEEPAHLRQIGASARENAPAVTGSAEPLEDLAVAAVTDTAETDTSEATSPVVTRGDRGPRIKGIDDRIVAENLPEVSDPAVARRRAEVLDGLIETPGGAPRIALAEGAELMSPEDRRRELHALAEEMELLFLERIAK